MTIQRTCVIGWPVEHSRSPLIHNYWLQTYEIRSEYIKREVHPSDLESFIEKFASEGFLGFNVTVPHKEHTARLVKPADELTSRLGAVNTVFKKGLETFGTNTDGHGFIANLKRSVPDFDFTKSTAVILGAGGSARAVAGALIDQGTAKLLIANRSEDRARELCTALGPRTLPIPWDRVADAMRNASLLVNATILGMKGQAKLELPLKDLHPHAVVADLVYVPLETEFLLTARRNGHRTADGLGMLLHQAQPAFARWYGIEPVVTDDLRRLVEADIGRE